MKLRCYLREIRGRRSVKEIAATAGINHGTLSMIERGRLLPKDELVEPLERAYGQPFETWYHELVRRVLEPDEEAA